jgi:hypothetical protein
MARDGRATYVIWEMSVYVGSVPDYPPVQRQGVYLETRGQSATLKTTFSLIAAPAPGKWKFLPFLNLLGQSTPSILVPVHRNLASFAFICQPVRA